MGQENHDTVELGRQAGTGLSFEAQWWGGDGERMGLGMPHSPSLPSLNTGTYAEGCDLLFGEGFPATTSFKI